MTAVADEQKLGRLPCPISFDIIASTFATTDSALLDFVRTALTKRVETIAKEKWTRKLCSDTFGEVLVDDIYASSLFHFSSIGSNTVLTSSS